MHNVFSKQVNIEYLINASTPENKFQREWKIKL